MDDNEDRIVLEATAEISTSVISKNKSKVADRNRSIIWYKRENEAFDWKIIACYATRLEEAYLNFLNGVQQNFVELRFDDFLQENVLVDFTKINDCN